eukprot:g2416.t1
MASSASLGREGGNNTQERQRRVITGEFIQLRQRSCALSRQVFLAKLKWSLNQSVVGIKYWRKSEIPWRDGGGESPEKSVDAARGPSSSRAGGPAERTMRELLGTCLSPLIPTDKHPKGGSTPNNEGQDVDADDQDDVGGWLKLAYSGNLPYDQSGANGQVAIFDLQAGEWRSFLVDGLEDFKVLRSVAEAKDFLNISTSDYGKEKPTGLKKSVKTGPITNAFMTRLTKSFNLIENFGKAINKVEEKKKSGSSECTTSQHTSLSAEQGRAPAKGKGGGKGTTRWGLYNDQLRKYNGATLVEEAEQEHDRDSDSDDNPGASTTSNGTSTLLSKAALNAYKSSTTHNRLHSAAAFGDIFDANFPSVDLEAVGDEILSAFKNIATDCLVPANDAAPSGRSELQEWYENSLLKDKSDVVLHHCF